MSPVKGGAGRSGGKASPKSPWRRPWQPPRKVGEDEGEMEDIMAGRAQGEAARIRALDEKEEQLRRAQENPKAMEKVPKAHAALNVMAVP